MPILHWGSGKVCHRERFEGKAVEWGRRKMESLGTGLLVVGFLGFLVSLVALVVALVRKKKRKLWSQIFVAFCVLIIVGGNMLSTTKTEKAEQKDAKAHNNLGGAYYHKGMLDEAITEYKRAIEINPKYAQAHINFNLAITYYYKKEYSLAIKHCDRAIELGWEVSPELLDNLEPYR